MTRETGHYHAGEKFYIFNLKDFSPMICFPKKQGMFVDCVCKMLENYMYWTRLAEIGMFILKGLYFLSTCQLCHMSVFECHRVHRHILNI